MQCNAEYRLYDKNKELAVTFYCLKEKGHEGPHEHTLEWEEDYKESIMGA